MFAQRTHTAVSKPNGTKIAGQQNTTILHEFRDGRRPKQHRSVSESVQVDRSVIRRCVGVIREKFPRSTTKILFMDPSSNQSFAARTGNTVYMLVLVCVCDYDTVRAPFTTMYRMPMAMVRARNFVCNINKRACARYTFYRSARARERACNRAGKRSKYLIQIYIYIYAFGLVFITLCVLCGWFVSTIAPRRASVNTETAAAAAAIIIEGNEKLPAETTIVV